MRRGIAEHMRRSLDTSAHVTSAIEVDMSRVVAIRARLKKEYQQSYGVNPTYLSFIARATVETLRDYPWINGELRPDLDRLALLDEDLREDAAAGARYLRVHLVGRDLEQRFVGFDLLALLLQPLRDRALGDGHAHLRHDDVDRFRGGHQCPFQ